MWTGKAHRPCGKARRGQSWGRGDASGWQGTLGPHSVAPDSPADPFLHPLPLPTPTARSIPSLPSPRFHQSRSAEGLPPGRGAGGRALPPPWASRQPGAPGPSGSSLSPSSRGRLTAGRKPRGSSGTRCRKLVRHSDCPTETGVAIQPAPAVRLRRGVGRGHRGAGLRCRRLGPGAPGPAFGPAPPPGADVVNRSLSVIWEMMGYNAGGDQVCGSTRLCLLVPVKNALGGGREQRTEDWRHLRDIMPGLVGATSQHGSGLGLERNVPGRSPRSQLSGPALTLCLWSCYHRLRRAGVGV